MLSRRPRRSHHTRMLHTGWVVAAYLLLSALVTAQDLTGTLRGTVRDSQGGVLPGAVVRLSSPALMGGTITLTTNAQGQLRFPRLPPGSYVMDVELQGFEPFQEKGIRIGAGEAIERSPVLRPAGIAESIVVEGASSHIEVRNSGFATRFGLEDLRAIPTRRSSMFDLVRSAPGVSPTSPSSGITTTISAMGSGTNENLFLFDGTNFTCPCNGVARTEPGVDFIQEVQVHSVGASAEFGNMQGAVINVVTRQGGDRFQGDASYYGQPSGLTSQPVQRPIVGAPGRQSGYERKTFRDFTGNVGGPLVRNSAWFFTGYQYLRDYDSQPGTDPQYPRTYEQDKVFAKVTWKLTANLQLLNSLHYEAWLNPASPTSTIPFEATTQTHAKVPAFTVGPLSHTLTSNTVWEVRVGRFLYAQEGPPSTGSRTTASRRERSTNVTSGAPAQFGDLTIIRTTGKATITHYRPRLFGSEHELKAGIQLERGEHHAAIVIPTGTRYIDNRGAPFQAVFSEPSNSGGLFLSGAVFVSDAISLGDRTTLNAGLRFDHTRAISQDLPALDAEGRETDRIVDGRGLLYKWNIVSPRLGITAKLTADGRTMLRASYGRFSQGVLTGELGYFHPGVSPVTTGQFEASTGGYTNIISRVDPTSLQIDAATRAPRTDEYSAGVDRQLGRQIGVAVAYVHKRGTHFIGWQDDPESQYREETIGLPDGSLLPVFVLTNVRPDRQYMLTNPADYFLKYNGLVMAVEKRPSRGWHMFGSYTLSRATGLQASSGTNPAGAQVSTVGPPYNTTFGRDPNDFTNARGRLPNDRPHMMRVMGSASVPRTGVVLAGNLQHFSGKPWAAATQIPLPQGDQRILLEPRGTRRLSSQTLLDVRMSRVVSLGGRMRVELLVDVLNALNDSAEEALASDVVGTLTFGQPTLFVDPRRVMFSARLSVGGR